MEHQILRQVLGKFKSVDTQPFRSIIPRGDAIPDTLEKAVNTKTPFFRDEKGATQHLAYQKLNDNEVELVQEPSPVTFRDEIFDQSVYDYNDGQIADIQQRLFDYISEDRARGTRGFGLILVNNQRRRPSIKEGNLSNISDPKAIRLNDYKARKAADGNRNKALSFKNSEAEVKRALDKFGAPERFDEIKRYVTKGNQQQHTIRAKTNKKNSNQAMSVGHRGSVKNGYLNTPENLFQEPSAQNYARQDKDDLPEEVLRMMGVFKTWEEYVAYYLFEDLQMHKILTKSDRNAIMKGGDFEKIYRRREELIERSV